jgi:hypothetical protein
VVQPAEHRLGDDTTARPPRPQLWGLTVEALVGAAGTIVGEEFDQDRAESRLDACGRLVKLRKRALESAEEVHWRDSGRIGR